MSYTDYFKLKGESQECYMWEYNEMDEKSSLYIHKWRVSEPIPQIIRVIVKFKHEFEIEQIINEKEIKNNPLKRNQPIIVMAERVSCHYQTVRFDTRIYNRQFDSIYVPNSFLEEDTNVKLIQVVVEWQ